MKWRVLVSILVPALVLSAPLSAAPPPQANEAFSTKGRLTETDPNELVVRMKNEGGLELTFRVIATTEIKEGETPKLFEDLAPGDAVTIDYTYNEDYEKVARLIEREAAAKPASP